LLPFPLDPEAEFQHGLLIVIQQLCRILVAADSGVLDKPIIPSHVRRLGHLHHLADKGKASAGPGDRRPRIDQLEAAFLAVGRFLAKGDRDGLPLLFEDSVGDIPREWLVVYLQGCRSPLQHDLLTSICSMVLTISLRTNSLATGRASATSSLAGISTRCSSFSFLSQDPKTASLKTTVASPDQSPL